MRELQFIGGDLLRAQSCVSDGAAASTRTLVTTLASIFSKETWGQFSAYLL